jgi:hypothetical protein
MTRQQLLLLPCHLELWDVWSFGRRGIPFFISFQPHRRLRCFLRGSLARLTIPFGIPVISDLLFSLGFRRCSGRCFFGVVVLPLLEAFPLASTDATFLCFHFLLFPIWCEEVCNDLLSPFGLLGPGLWSGFLLSQRGGLPFLSSLSRCEVLPLFGSASVSVAAPMRTSCALGSGPSSGSALLRAVFLVLMRLGMLLLV